MKSTKQTKLRGKLLCYKRLDLEDVFPPIVEKNLLSNDFIQANMTGSFEVA